MPITYKKSPRGEPVELKAVCTCGNKTWVIGDSGYECIRCGTRARDLSGPNIFEPITDKG